MALITIADIQAVKQLSDNLALTKINPFIAEAEELDLKPQLGAAMYKALVDNKDDGDVYQTLLEGEDYTCGNETINYPGIKKILAYYAYSRYLSEQDSFSTVSGMVQPGGQNSSALSEKSITRKIGQARSAGAHYMEEMHKYLCAKKASYPLYKGDDGHRKRRKINITAIG